MSYTIVTTPIFDEDLAALIKTGDKQAVKKLHKLLDELREHPMTGTGEPKELKHNYTGYWSRRITLKHRLIYRIEDETVTVFVLQCYGHYGDK
jgi:toxin YoeB